MPKTRIIKVKFEPNRPPAQNVNYRVVMPGKKKQAPGMLKPKKL